MSITPPSRGAIKTLAFGDTRLPQEFTVGLVEPNAEIAVWLDGMGLPLDVTRCHCAVCSEPFIICVGFEGRKPNPDDLGRLSLRFCERDGQKRVLGEIGLRVNPAISGADSELLFFEARSSANYCLPKRYLWAHYLLHACSQWRRDDSSEVKMTFLERRAAMVTFIRPHPVSLVSLAGEAGGNIFPMNISNELGNGRFAFALREDRLASHLVEQAGRIAVSSVPVTQAPVAYQLASNHRRRAIDWDRLPFATKMSAKFSIPVPIFALRVREMEIEQVYKLGSHTCFVARTIADETFAEGPGLCVIHGFYQAWRLQGRRAELQASVAEDSSNKRGLYQVPGLE